MNTIIHTNEGDLEIPSEYSCSLCDNCDSHRNNNLVGRRKGTLGNEYICSYHASSFTFDPEEDNYEELEESIKQQ